MRQTCFLTGTFLAVAVVFGLGWEGSGQDNSGKKNPPDQPAKEKGKDGPGMMCPMMTGMAGLRLHVDGPAALLARSEELGLDEKQKKQLEEIEEAARQQARKVLTEKQHKQLGDVPKDRIGVMEMAMARMKKMMAGKEPGCCCPMCAEMMKKAQPGKPAEKGTEEKDKTKG